MKMFKCCLFFKYLTCIIFYTLFSNALASTFEEDLQVAWEMMWDERGTPTQLQKWDNASGNLYTYKITGNHSSADRSQIEKILSATNVLTGLNFKEQTDHTAEVPIEFKFVPDSELGDTVGCAAQALKRTGYKLEKAWIRLKNRSAYTCIAHEIMHLLGLPGHPEGKTVLTYFPWRRDIFMRLDELILKTVYSTDVPAGATPFKVLQAFAKTLQADNAYNLTTLQYEQTQQVFYNKKIQEMEQFALGVGEIPQIVIRSGRSQQGFIRSAKVAVAYQLGLAYRNATLVKADMIQAMKWFELSANRGYLPAQLALVQAYMNGRGIEKNYILAAQWAGLMIKNNPNIDKTLFNKMTDSLNQEQKIKIEAWIEAFKVDENY
jgi:Sel1 repeat